MYVATWQQTLWTTAAYPIGGIGCIFQLGILLLLVPGSPARIGTAPFICLAVWVVLGFIFYFSNKKHWISLPEEKVRENVLGRKDIAVFFKK